MKKLVLSVAVSTLLFASSHSFAKVSPEAVLGNYADIAQAVYEDSLTSAKQLEKTIDAFLAAPTEANLSKAKAAWKASRVPYQQSEAYRFGNKIVDDWEGKVNAWPLDEGLIDYVNTGAYGTESDENPLYTANIIANKTLNIAGKTISAPTITKAFLADTLQEADEIEANVATGYHAIEFLLWGQDLNGTNAGAGARKASDYDTKNCSNGNCERRGDYLKAATSLLVDDLAWMTKQWAVNGEARLALGKEGASKGLATIVSGLGSLSYGELAGERMKLGLMLHDPEEEHDCFSDNTHNSHFFDAKGVQNVYLGSYQRIDGSTVKGASISELVADKDKAVDTAVTKNLAVTMDKMQVLVATAQKGEAYDQMIAEGNKTGNEKVMQAVNALVKQARSMEKIVTALGLPALKFEGSDSLDAPENVE